MVLTKYVLRMRMHFLSLMKSRTGYLGVRSPPSYICEVVTGSYLSTAMTTRKHPSAQVQEWGCFSSTECHLDIVGAVSIFKGRMDEVMWGLSFLTTYQDDILIHSRDEEAHTFHLQGFECLAQAGLMLQGKKCHYKDVSNLLPQTCVFIIMDGSRSTET